MFTNNNTLRIVIPGGSGQVGSVLARAFHAARHDVVVLSRRPAVQPWRVVVWDGIQLGAWRQEIDGCDVLINLTGRSVNCRYNAANRREILESRVQSTRVLGEAVIAATRPPRAWLQASTATIYSHRYDAPNDERSGVLGGHEPHSPDTWRFSIDVANAWEHTFVALDLTMTRKVLLRSAMTMSPDRGGIFDVLVGLVRHGLGGRAGDGRQFMSWIHYEDFVAAIRWLIGHDEIDGIVNLASPNPLTNSEFMRNLRKAYGAPVGLPAPGLVLEIGTRLLRTESELILKSRRVVPTRLLEHGFAFRFPNWDVAAEDLCRQWRGRRRTSSA